MKKTKNYAMPYPEQDDYFNVEDFQDMMVSVDDLMKKLSDSGAQISSDAEHLYNQTKAQMDNIQKRMNAFTALKEGSTTGDAELTDIRVAYDGREYGNAGEAVREQASDIHKALFGAGASIWSKAKSESTKYVAETKGICILNERFTAAGVVAKISRGTFAQNESTLNLDRECSAYIVEFEKNPGTVYMPSAETIKIVSTTKIIFEANGNARCWIPVEKGQYLAIDSTATAYTCESNHVPYMLYDQANKTLEYRGFGATGSTKPVDPYSLALEYKLEYDMDDTGIVKQIDANRKVAALLKEDIVDHVINVSTLNIYDKSATDNIINYALQPNGEPIEFDGRCVTSFIKLDAGTDYQMVNYQNAISAICYYDDSKAVISKDGEWHNPLSVINIPSVAFRRYIRVELFNTTTFDGDSVKLVVCKKGLLDGNYHEYNEVKKEYKFGTKDIDNSANFLTKSEAKQLITNNTANFITESEAKQLIVKPYEKLKWYALGDSYTEQGYYTSKIVEKTGMILTNYGVGGTRLADSDGHQTDAMCYRYLNMSDEKPDLITVMGGTNDCYYSTLGKAGDTSVSTVAGAIYVIYKGLQEKYPNTPILFASMPVRWDTKFEEYANIMIDTCKYWRIPCVDIYHNCGFNSWNKSIYNLNGDGIHVNENGGKVLAQLFIDAMNKVIY